VTDEGSGAPSPGELPTADASLDAGEPPEPSDTARSSLLVAAGIFLSRIAGLVRESATGAYLGAGAAGDAFRAALRIPNLLQNLLGEGVLSAAFIPVYSRFLAEDREEDAGRLAGAIAGLLALLTGVLVVIGVVFARPLTTLLAFGFEGEKFELTVDLVRVMTAGIGFLVLSAWCLGVLNSHRRFFLSYVAPVIWNVAQIAVLLFVGLRGWAEVDVATALAWGVFAGGLLQFLVQLPGVRQVAPDIRLSLKTDTDGVRESIRRFGPAILGRGALQLVAYVDLVLASLLTTGAVAALGYAQVLYILPVSLFAMSVAAAELPELSRSSADPEALQARLDRGLGRISFFMTFTVAAYLVAGSVIIAAIYQRGRFEADDTTLVWLILAAYATGLVSIGASRLLQNLLYSVGDVRATAQIAFIRVAVSSVLGFVLMYQFERLVVTAGSVTGFGDLPAPLVPLSQAIRDSGTLRLGAAGLALAASVGAWVEVYLLQRKARQHLGRPVRVAHQQSRFLLAGLAAAAVMFLAMLLTGSLPGLLRAPLVLGPGGLAYLVVAKAQGAPEVDAVLGPLLRRLPGQGHTP
jgi:putative peptidoglycan lipid II flippase